MWNLKSNLLSPLLYPSSLDTLRSYWSQGNLIIIICRENVALGIPDKLFCIGDSIILQIIGELNMLPILVLACRMCPKNIEGTMYALIMSTLNLGSLLST